jgi:hypothetical protein
MANISPLFNKETHVSNEPGDTSNASSNDDNPILE